MWLAKGDVIVSVKYRELATKGANYLSEISGDTIGTVIVFDKDNIDKVVDEYRK
jgi:hypothetical protein